MDQPDRFELATELLGPLPVINAFCARLGLAALLESYLPREDARLRLAPATAVGVVVRNLVIGREPVYALGEWAAPFDPALLGLADDEAGLLNDDRVGRTLARLFDADRASMLTRLGSTRCGCSAWIAHGCTTIRRRSSSPARTRTRTGARGAASGPPRSRGDIPRTTAPT